jgi:hypothetical protein
MEGEGRHEEEVKSERSGRDQGEAPQALGFKV